MLSWETWEILDYIGMELRKSSRPFGGIKIIATGDFYQLPPVKGMMLIENNFLSYFDYTIILTKSYRSQDPILNSILQSVRTGKELSDEHHMLLKTRVNKETITYPLLVSLRDTAYTMNNDKLSKNVNGNLWSNTSEMYCIDMKTNAKIHSNEVFESIATNECNLENKIVLKIGAPVIYLVNDMEKGLVNGSVGTIVKFNGNNPVAQFSEGKLVEIEKHNYKKEFPDVNTTVVIEQYPLLLAYAITIHRAQGQTLSQGTLLLDNTIFECGQAYVALSRFQTLDSIILLRYKKSVFKINCIVKEFYDKFDLNNCL
jgi:ATP-dependent DNA helicase PIF1